MPTSNKTTDFTGHDFYVGIDVHKNSWTVTVRTSGIEVAHFTQLPVAGKLAVWLDKRYPGGNYLSAYEAGFCGTSHHQDLCDLGIKNIVIHPADLPQTNKQQNNKTDLHDSRSIASYLQAGVLKGIYIMPVDQQLRRALFRCRQAKVKDVTRCINRLRSLLYFLGVQIPDVFKDKHRRLSNNFLQWLAKLQLSAAEGTLTLNQYMEELKYQRRQLVTITKQLKAAVTTHYAHSYTRLLTVPGIGPITAIGLLTETGDLRRFDNPNQFASYLGLVPGEQSSGETIYHSGIQPRCNKYLRPLMIEAAWVAIRRCPALLSYYKKHARGVNNKAIVKVARRLAMIAKAVVINKSVYQSAYGL